MVRGIFKQADSESTGWLDRGELASAVEASLSESERQEHKNIDPDGSEIAALFEEMDADKDGRISFSEFARWWAHGDGDMDSKFMKWWFKDAVRRSFKLKKKDLKGEVAAAKEQCYQ